MKRKPEVETWLHRRLQEAVDKFADSSADAFGRLIGYTNGGSVRQSLRGDRPVQQAIIERSREVPALVGWFDLPSNPHTLKGDETPEDFDLLSNVVTHALPQAVTWETVVKEFEQLPNLFWVVVPGDDVSPHARSGDSIEFQKGSDALPGDIVIVRTKSGSLLMRIYVEIEPGVFRAEGMAGRASLHSAQDEIKRSLLSKAAFEHAEAISWTLLCQ